MIIEMKDVICRNGNFALTCDDLTIGKGTITAIIGRNGSGKSTLLKVMEGSVQSMRGHVKIDGRGVGNYSPRELSRKMSFVQQEILNPLGFTVRDVMAVSGYSRDQSDAAIRQALDVFGIEHLMERQFTELSGGERRLVTLAGAVYQDSDIIVLDEPTTFLDIDKELIVYEVLEMLRETGKTVVIVMHDLHSVYKLADFVVIMKDGKLMSYGETSSIMTGSILSEAFGVKFEVQDTPEGRSFIGRRNSQELRI